MGRPTTSLKSAGVRGEKRKYARYAKPPYSYKGLITAAILLSGETGLKLQQIYEALKQMGEFFADNAEYKGWKESIRHTLSKHEAFFQEKSKRTRGNPWCVNITKIEEKDLLLQASSMVMKSGEYLEDHYPEDLSGYLMALFGKNWSSLVLDYQQRMCCLDENNNSNNIATPMHSTPAKVKPDTSTSTTSAVPPKRPYKYSSQPSNMTVASEEVPVKKLFVASQSTVPLQGHIIMLVPDVSYHANLLPSVTEAEGEPTVDVDSVSDLVIDWSPEEEEEEEEQEEEKEDTCEAKQATAADQSLEESFADIADMCSSPNTSGLDILAAVASRRQLEDQ